MSVVTHTQICGRWTGTWCLPGASPKQKSWVCPGCIYANVWCTHRRSLSGDGDYAHMNPAAVKIKWHI